MACWGRLPAAELSTRDLRPQCIPDLHAPPCPHPHQHQSSRGWPIPRAGLAPRPPSAHPAAVFLPGWTASWDTTGPGLCLGDAGTWRGSGAPFHIAAAAGGWGGGAELLARLRVPRMRGRWRAFVALLSMRGVLQQLLAGNEKMREPVFFALIGLVWGRPPSLGTTVITQLQN